MQRLLTAALLTSMSLMLAGCGNESRTDPPNVGLLALHADPTLETVFFRRVQANRTPLEYSETEVFDFDVDTYTFNFDVSAPDGTVAETISSVETLVEGSDYILVLRSAAGSPTVQLIELPRPDTLLATQAQLLHTADVVDTVDVYLEPAGFDVLAATRWGTIGNGDVLPPTGFDAGSYELAVTQPNDPMSVLFRSSSFSISSGETLFMFIADTNGGSLGDISLVRVTGSNEELVDVNVGSGIRVINAVQDRTAIDAGIDMQLAPPLIENIPFGTVSDLALITDGSHSITITPAGQPGVLEVDSDFDATLGAVGTFLVSGSPGALDAIFFDDDFRVIANEAKFRAFNASPLNTSVDVFVLPAGTAPASNNVTATVDEGEASNNQRIAPGDYNLTIRAAGSSTVLAGPTPITIDAQGYYAILLADPLSGSGVDVIFLYDFI